MLLKYSLSLASLAVLGLGCGFTNNNTNTSATGDETGGTTDDPTGGQPTTGGSMGSDVTIFDLQQDKVPVDTIVRVKDVVVTSPTNFTKTGAGTFFVQDPAGGEYSGIQVYIYADTAMALMAEGKVPKQGDKITLVGEYVEFVPMGAMSPDSLSEINLGNPADLTITGSATAPTPPVVDPADVATGGAKAENFEGVPVTVQNVAVTAPADTYGQYTVTGGLLVDDYFIYYAEPPAADAQGLTLTGVMMYSFDTFKLAPRTCDDVMGYTCSGDPPETTTSTTGPMGDVTIFDIQKGAVAPMSVVTVENVIVTTGLTFKKDGFFVQDPMGGEYSGIYVYVGMNPDGLQPKPGDVVTINGLYTEYFDMSQISASQAGDITVTGTDTVPAPAVVPAADIATGGAKAENWEGVLVRVEGVTVATAADNFGEWTVDAMLHVDDLFFAIADWPKPMVGEMFASITGPLMYSFDNFKIVPRDAADLAK